MWGILEEMDAYEKAHPQPKQKPASDNGLSERQRRAQQFDNRWQPARDPNYGGYQGTPLWNPWRLPWEQ